MSADSNSPIRKRVKHHDNGEPHFLTFSYFRHLNLLSKDRTRKWFIEALNAARTMHGFHLWAWVIMPEHVHVLLWPPFDLIDPDPRGMRGRIRGILTSIKRPVGIQAMAFLRDNAPDYLQRPTVIHAERRYQRFWKPGSGHDEIVSEPAALHALVEYVHLNPVRRGLAQHAEDWPWSSARDWKQMPDSLLTLDRTLPATVETPWKLRCANRPE